MNGRTSKTKVARKAATIVLAGTTTLSAPAALAGVHLTASISTSTNNVPYTTHSSMAGSGSIGFDLGRYIRLGYTHRRELTATEAWKVQVAPSETATVAQDGSGVRFVKAYNSTLVTSNSIDLTLVLYEGVVFMPYLIGGGVVKTYTFSSRLEGEEKADEDKVTTPPVPNVGFGVGLRLNRDFTLKLSYVASPGISQAPNGKEVGVWDRYTTIGIAYQI